MNLKSTWYTVFLLIMLPCLIISKSCIAMPQEARSHNFVYLHEIDPTILISVRYYSSENFIGKPIEGYKCPVIILTKQAAHALKHVQEEVKKYGYCLVVYDGYRPQKAVDYFVQWSNNTQDQIKKSQYYPRVDKAQVFELGYVAKRSGHSRGSTVDLTIIKSDQKLHAIEEKNRTLSDGYTITMLDDGTVDMGSSFDLFDTASHTSNDCIYEQCKKRRCYLKMVMEKHRFKNYSKEWWHFTLHNEPFPADKDSSYFNFDVE